MFVRIGWISLGGGIERETIGMGGAECGWRGKSVWLKEGVGWRCQCGEKVGGILHGGSLGGGGRDRQPEVRRSSGLKGGGREVVRAEGGRDWSAWPLSRRAGRRPARRPACVSAPSTAGCAPSGSPSWNHGSPGHAATGKGSPRSPVRMERTYTPGSLPDLGENRTNTGVRGTCLTWASENWTNTDTVFIQRIL